MLITFVTLLVSVSSPDSSSVVQLQTYAVKLIKIIPVCKRYECCTASKPEMIYWVLCGYLSD